MAIVTFVLIGVAVAGPLAWLAARDHRRACERRAKLLDDCMLVLQGAELVHDGASAFPRLRGAYGTLDVDVQLICDMMTLRRLPQLWLQVTVLEKRPGIGGIAALVRPSGYEFYSLTGTFEHVIEPPPPFPAEMIVRSKSVDDEAVFQRISAPMAAILSDPHVKEIAVTGEGLRIIRQAAEGRRGEYLLLRQAVFDATAVTATLLERSLLEIESLRASLAEARNKVSVA